MNSFNMIFALLGIRTFTRYTTHTPKQVDIFMALAFMASYKAASTFQGAKSAAEEAWLFLGNEDLLLTRSYENEC